MPKLPGWVAKTSSAPPPSARTTPCSSFGRARSPTYPTAVSDAASVIPSESPIRVGMRSGARMRAEVRLAHVVGRDVRVHLRRLDRGVAEHLLDASQVGAALDEMRGEGVPQGVRRHVLLDADAAGVVADELEHGLPGDAAAAVGQEEHVAALHSPEVLAAALEVRQRCVDCALSHRNDALL